MKIKISSKGSKKLKEFNKKEWQQANLEHFGHALDWNTKHYILAAYDNQDLVGTLSLKIEAGVAYIGTMLIAKDKRRKGIGQNLMDKAQQIAKQNNAHKIYLQTGKDWQSVQFYEKLGYKITGQLPNHYFHKDFVELTLFI